MFTIKWIGPDGSLKAQDNGEEEARLVVDGEYEEGDRLIVESTQEAVYAWLQIEDALGMRCSPQKHKRQKAEKSFHLAPFLDFSIPLPDDCISNGANVRQK